MHRLSRVVTGSRIRRFHAAPISPFPRKRVGEPAPPQLQKTGMLLDEDEEIDTEDDLNEGTSAGHLYLERQRQTLHYLRLIEHDMPRLVHYRKPFEPPTEGTPVAIRTLSYGGEDHPAIAKRVIVVPVAKLPLQTPEAIHTVKLLAGTRWTSYPPRDSGFSSDEDGGEHGYIKISSEDFPQPGMNLKWASDVLDNLIAQAELTKDKFSTLPLDVRHLEVKRFPMSDGELRPGEVRRRPTLRDFPPEWLPPPQANDPDLTVIS